MLEARAITKFQRMKSYTRIWDILSRYYKFGEITEDEMKSRLGINETKEEDCGCNPINEQPVAVHNRTSNGNIVTTLKESDLNEQETILYEFGKKVTRLLEKNVPTNPSKWSYYKALKKKFDVYPSAYANGWKQNNTKAWWWLEKGKIGVTMKPTISKPFKSNDRTFDKVYNTFDKRDYFNSKGLAKLKSVTLKKH